VIASYVQPSVSHPYLHRRQEEPSLPSERHSDICFSLHSLCSHLTVSSIFNQLLRFPLSFFKKEVGPQRPNQPNSKCGEGSPITTAQQHNSFTPQYSRADASGGREHLQKQKSSRSLVISLLKACFSTTHRYQSSTIRYRPSGG